MENSKKRSICNNYHISKIQLNQMLYVAYTNHYTVYDNLHDFGTIDFIIF